MGMPLDVFEGQVGLPRFCDTGVVKPRDVGMRQAFEDVALPAMRSESSAVEQSRMRQLQSHLAPGQSLHAARSQPYGAHAAASELADQSIWADAITGRQHRMIAHASALRASATERQVSAITSAVLAACVRRQQLRAEMDASSRLTSSLMPSIQATLGAQSRAMSSASSSSFDSLGHTAGERSIFHFEIRTTAVQAAIVVGLILGIATPHGGVGHPSNATVVENSRGWPFVLVRSVSQDTNHVRDGARYEDQMPYFNLGLFTVYGVRRGW